MLTVSAALPLDKILTPPVIRLLVLAGILAVVEALLRSPFVKGRLGELQVNIAARLLLDKRRYNLVERM